MAIKRITKTQKKLVLEALKQVKQQVEEGGTSNLGICDLLVDAIKTNYKASCGLGNSTTWEWGSEEYKDWVVLRTASERILNKLFKSWPMYSGSSSFPVPGKKGESPSWAFDKADDLWAGSYGKKRKQLLNYMIKTLKEELE